MNEWRTVMKRVARGEPVFFLARDPLILSEGFSFSAGEIFSG
jgi:hypothetical protein